MKQTKRRFLQTAMALGASWAGARKALAGQHEHHPRPAPRQTTRREEAAPPVSPGGISMPVETPDVQNLPYKVESGVKVFNLIAEPVKRHIVPFKTMDVWGYNGSCPGPAIQVNQGDRVRIILDNHLPESTTIHWHGLRVPNTMDGAPGMTQQPIPPGGTFAAEFTPPRSGTFPYHSHLHELRQIGSGMYGAIIAHCTLEVP